MFLSWTLLQKKESIMIQRRYLQKKSFKKVLKKSASYELTANMLLRKDINNQWDGDSRPLASC